MLSYKPWHLSPVTLGNSLIQALSTLDRQLLVLTIRSVEVEEVIEEEMSDVEDVASVSRRL